MDAKEAASASGVVSLNLIRLHVCTTAEGLVRGAQLWKIS
jgi:hypothetical protein